MKLELKESEIRLIHMALKNEIHTRTSPRQGSQSISETQLTRDFEELITKFEIIAR